MVNINERRLVAWRRGFVTEKVDLVGLEYLWKAVLVAPDNIVYKPIELLRDVYTNLSPKLQQDQVLWVNPDYMICPIHLFVIYAFLCADSFRVHSSVHAATSADLRESSAVQAW